MRIVLLGDSYLARIRRDLPLLGEEVVLNAARGGATVLDLERQATAVGLTRDDVAIVSVGTNDAAPHHAVDLARFGEVMARFLRSHPVARWVLVAPPGVDESRPGARGRTNAEIATYRDVLASLDVPVLDTHALIAQLGYPAWADDGLHLSGAAYRLLLPAIADTTGG